MDPTKRVNDLITITSRLAELLERENDALRNHRNAELHEILDDKVTLGRVYESRMLSLNEEPDALQDIDPELRDRLKALGEKVNVLMEENAKLLKIAIEANRRVVELIAEAVKEAAPSAGTYAPNGAGNAPRPNGSNSVAISVDQTL